MVENVMNNVCGKIKGNLISVLRYTGLYMPDRELAKSIVYYGSLVVGLCLCIVRYA